MTTLIDLTHPIHEDMPVYPGTEQPVTSIGCSIEQDGFLEKKITFYSHTGTHMDAPAHLIKGGKFLDQYDIGHFYGSAIVVHLESNEDNSIDLGVLNPVENQLKNIDFLLIHTGWSRYWGTDNYFSNFPVLTPEAAEWVAGIGLKGIGFDAISADSADTRTYPIHKILLGSDMVIVENLANLDQLHGGAFGFSCFPLYFQQADGSPIRAVASI
ncbi:cyclase family protein [Desulfobacula sp.]|uniref:cyclase family protein n=1 Tax=Desulfobacula sp. TaxID=2593537 RepID=UPI00260CDD16|nr:cyclase family protein [Desulfobacula sp.]